VGLILTSVTSEPGLRVPRVRGRQVPGSGQVRQALRGQVRPVPALPEPGQREPRRERFPLEPRV
jgi:hypothetical protein